MNDVKHVGFMEDASNFFGHLRDIFWMSSGHLANVNLYQKYLLVYGKHFDIHHKNNSEFCWGAWAKYI